MKGASFEQNHDIVVALNVMLNDGKSLEDVLAMKKTMTDDLKGRLADRATPRDVEWSDVPSVPSGITCSWVAQLAGGKIQSHFAVTIAAYRSKGSGWKQHGKQFPSWENFEMENLFSTCFSQLRVATVLKYMFYETSLSWNIPIPQVDMDAISKFGGVRGLVPNWGFYL